MSIAKEIIGRYPRPKSALIPLLHLAQEQDGHLTNEAMAHIAELIGHTPSEVLGPATFYEMFKFEPVGTFLVNICQTMSCALMGAAELMHHAEESLGIKAGGTTPDGLITLEHAECQAACTEAPCLQVNYRYRYRVTNEAARRAVRRARVPAPSTARSRRTARSPASVSTSRPTAASARAARGRHRPAAVGPRGNGVLRRNAMTARTRTPPGSSPGSGRRSSRRASARGLLHTRPLPRHRRLRGLKAALRRAPAEVHEEVRSATVLGRGGAGFPAGVKWGLTPQGVWPRYLVVNGDESEPGTYKDRLLMELDPHQLIEGCLIACYAAGLSQCFLYIRGEMAVAQERVAAALNEAYAAGYVGKNILGTDFSVDIVDGLGRRRLHRRRGDGAHREPRGQPRDAAAEAAVLPSCHRVVRAADDRQQRRDAVATCRG